MNLFTNISFFITIFVIFLQISSQWKTDRRPRIFGRRLRWRNLSPRRPRLQLRITQFHNYFRTKVRPRASNMLAMEWSPIAASAAQSWANTCKFLVHDSPEGRTVQNYGPCGQNIFVSTQKVPWFFAIKTWWLERRNFTFGSPTNDLFVVGHYTQMVWAASHQVGCGIAYCPHASPAPFYNYVCNYCPIGNYQTSLSQPYKRGRPCKYCRGQCKAKKLCTNPCHSADQWSNCKQLDQRFHNWLCNTRKTPQGKERFQKCLATCLCKNKIKFPYN